MLDAKHKVKYYLVNDKERAYDRMYEAKESGIRRRKRDGKDRRPRTGQKPIRGTPPRNSTGGSNKKVGAVEKKEKGQSAAKRKALGSVYIIETTDGAMVKIGHTKMISNRLREVKSLISERHTDIRIIGFFPGTQQMEGQLHQYFSDCRVKGEWYDRSSLLKKIRSTGLTLISLNQSKAKRRSKCEVAGTTIEKWKQWRNYKLPSKNRTTK